MKNKIVIGVGNYLMSDDGIGCRIIEKLNDINIDLNFDFEDISNNGMEILSFLKSDIDTILIIDSAYMNKNPGEASIFSIDDIETNKIIIGNNIHEGDIIYILKKYMSILDNNIPRIYFMGIQPYKIEPGFELSNILSKNMSLYLDMVINFMK